MSKAKIYINNIFCGVLVENSDGYFFKYDSEYLKRADAVPLSPTMPLQEEEFEKEFMFPVFDGLIPEGWLLDIVDKNWKINPRDRVRLVNEKDPDELALPLVGAGKMNDEIIQGFCKNDFVDAMVQSGVSNAVAEIIISKMASHKYKWFDIIEISFLSEEFKDKYKALIDERISRIV